MEERKLIIAKLVRDAGGCRDAVAFPVEGHVLVAVEVCGKRSAENELQGSVGSFIEVGAVEMYFC